MWAFIVGWAISCISAVLIVLVLTKWSWVQTRLGWLFHWGGPGGFFGLRFPASKEGALLGSTMGLIFGMTAIVQENDRLLAERLGVLLVALLLLAIPMGVRDYRLSRVAERQKRTKNQPNKSRHRTGDNVLP